MNLLNKLLILLGIGAANELIKRQDLKKEESANKPHEPASSPKEEPPCKEETKTAPEPVKTEDPSQADATEKADDISLEAETKKPEPNPLENIQFTEPTIFRPLHFAALSQNIPAVELTSKEAVELGYSFRKRKSSVIITGFHGSAPEKLIIPCSIASLPVKEISSGVFSKAELNEVYIPDTVLKLGHGVFKRSSITKVVFGDGLSSIPDTTFSECYRLEEAILPLKVRHIGKFAFSCCHSLTCIGFPKGINEIEDDAFYSSGLESFCVETEKNNIINAKAFYHTPMYEKYDIVNTSMVSSNLKILHVVNSKPLKLTADKIEFLPHSLRYFRLDLTGCKKINFRRRAVSKNRNVPEYLNSSSSNCIIKLPDGIRRNNYAFLPEYVDVFDSSGNYIEHNVCSVSSYYLTKDIDDIDDYYDYEDELDEKYGDRKIYEYSADTSFFPEFSLKTDRKRICVNSERICENAIDSETAEEVIIDFPYFKSEGCIFTKNCVNVRKVSLYNDKIIKYLPPVQLVDRYLKAALLNAFSACAGPYGHSNSYGLPGRRRTFFNRDVIDSIFCERKVCARDNPYINRVVPRWFKKDRMINVSNRFKALVAVDVLRSGRMTHETDTKMYSDFLKSHRGFCYKYFRQISKDFPEYLSALEEMELG